MEGHKLTDINYVKWGILLEKSPFANVYALCVLHLFLFGSALHILGKTLHAASTITTKTRCRSH